jgi:hypothetical protein
MLTCAASAMSAAPPSASTTSTAGVARGKTVARIEVAAIGRRYYKKDSRPLNLNSP